MPGYVGVRVGKTDGANTEFETAEEVGLTIAHELLHQGGVVHPTENNASTDVRLNRDNNGGPNDYLTTPNNDPSVLNNIMLYNLYNVNGTNVGGL